MTMPSGQYPSMERAGSTEALSKGVCPECGTGVGQKRVPKAGHWIHWRRLVPMVVVGLVVCALGAMSLRTASTYSHSQGWYEHPPAEIGDELTVSDLKEIASGESGSGTLIDDEIFGGEFPWIEHPGQKLILGIANGQGSKLDAWWLGWPAAWIETTRMTSYEDMARRTGMYQPAATGSPMTFDSLRLYRDWFTTINESRPGLVLDCGAVILSVVMLLIAWYVPRVLIPLGCLAARGIGHRKWERLRSSFGMRRWQIGSVCLVLSGIAVLTMLDSSTQAILEWGTRGAMWEAGEIPMGEVVAALESSTPNQELAKIVVQSMGSDTPDDAVVLAYWEVTGISTETTQYMVGWPSNFFFKGDFHYTDLGVADVGTLRLREESVRYNWSSSWLFRSAPGTGGELARATWALDFRILSVAAFGLWICWQCVRVICWLVARRVTRKRLRRHMCVVCGYELPSIAVGPRDAGGAEA